MRKLFAGILILLLISSGACAEVDAIRLEAPETPEQKILFEISSAQTARLAANYAATASALLDVEHEAGTVSDALYDFIARLESGTAEPTSVVLLLPTERFGLSEDLREIVSDAVADEEKEENGRSETADSNLPEYMLYMDANNDEYDAGDDTP